MLLKGPCSAHQQILLRCGALLPSLYSCPAMSGLLVSGEAMVLIKLLQATRLQGHRAPLSHDDLYNAPITPSAFVHHNFRKLGRELKAELRWL